MPKVKITVVKKSNFNDMFGGNPPVAVDQTILMPECHIFDVGQEFIIGTNRDATPAENWETAPPGFCGWAFADIQRDIIHILWGGSYPWFKAKGTAISCCTDGTRPVVFKIERIEA